MQGRTIWETRAQSLGWEDPLEEGIATHSSVIGGQSHGQGSLVVRGVMECQI